MSSSEVREDVDSKWITFQLIYNQLGTVFLRDQVSEVLGKDAYALDLSREGTGAFLKFAKSGIFKVPEVTVSSDKT